VAPRRTRRLTGRKPKLSAAQVVALREWADFATSKVQACRRLGIGKSALESYLKGKHKRLYGGPTKGGPH
jgi:hypothetical protein